MLRFKTKFVAVIFSQPFLKHCHLVGVEVRCVRACACVCKVVALMCICGCLHSSTYIYVGKCGVYRVCVLVCMHARPVFGI